MALKRLYKVNRINSMSPGTNMCCQNVHPEIMILTSEIEYIHRKFRQKKINGKNLLTKVKRWKKKSGYRKDIYQLGETLMIGRLQVTRRKQTKAIKKENVVK